MTYMETTFSIIALIVMTFADYEYWGSLIIAIDTYRASSINKFEHQKQWGKNPWPQNCLLINSRRLNKDTWMEINFSQQEELNPETVPLSKMHFWVTSTRPSLLFENSQESSNAQIYHNTSLLVPYYTRMRQTTTVNFVQMTQLIQRTLKLEAFIKFKSQDPRQSIDMWFSLTLKKSTFLFKN